MSQYEDVRTQLKALHDSMDVSDSDNELDEADVAQCAALYEKEMALETAIQALENPLLRFLQHDTNFRFVSWAVLNYMLSFTVWSLPASCRQIFLNRDLMLDYTERRTDGWSDNERQFISVAEGDLVTVFLLIEHNLLAIYGCAVPR